MKVVWSYVKVNKRGGPLDDVETKDLVDVEAPRNRRERRAVEAWKRKQARAQRSGKASR
ncbi:hypothetical protein [Nonomuraea typhae]|uniref:hypothetical protein n=1 Tax=Nonomuraea typhae TaxID=2603600 RepID=UPI0012F71215|nr:hypothetical protein [Nonomuraea typhae]